MKAQETIQAELQEALNVSREDFLKAGQAALATRPRIEQVIQDAHTKGFKSIFFIGSGGTYANVLQFEHLFQVQSTLTVRFLVAAEAILSPDPLLDETAIAVFTSDSGTTEDVVAAIEFCKARNVHTIGLTPVEDSPIAQKVDAHITTAKQWFGWDIYLLLFVTHLLSLRGEFADYSTFADELSALPAALREVETLVDPQAEAFAKDHANIDYLFLVGSGNLWGFTYIYSMCVIEEKFWIQTTRVTGAEFFHGALELIEPDTTIMILQGEDFTRPLTDRAIRFAKDYSRDVTVIDTADFPLPGISERFRPLLSSAVQKFATQRFTFRLAQARNRDLDLRRYYRVVEY